MHTTVISRYQCACLYLGNTILCPFGLLSDEMKNILITGVGKHVLAGDFGYVSTVVVMLH